MVYSDDGGVGWELGGRAVEGTDESTAVETGDGWICLNCRNVNRGKDPASCHRAIEWLSAGEADITRL